MTDLILRRRASAVSKDGDIGTGASWFERRFALLTMRVCYFPYVSRIFAWIFAMPAIQRS